MEFLLQREQSTSKSTPGKLYLIQNEKPVFFCYTLEDVVRAVKIKGQTAIPEGRYRVVVTMSNRFKKRLPLLLLVPNFEGVRLHGGNTHENTEGCPLLGKNRDSLDRISNCAPAVKSIIQLIDAASARKEQVWIEVKNV
jgi:hypothetical protein